MFEYGLVCVGFSTVALKDPLMVDVPCKHPERRNETSTLRAPVILPHELLSWLAEHHRFYVAPGAIKSFWQRWKQFKPYHPAQETEIHNPLGIGGDDARYTLGGAKIIIICLNLVLVDRATKSQSNDINTQGHYDALSMFFTFYPSPII